MKREMPKIQFLPTRQCYIFILRSKSMMNNIPRVRIVYLEEKKEKDKHYKKNNKQKSQAKYSAQNMTCP